MSDKNVAEALTAFPSDELLFFRSRALRGLSTGFFTRQQIEAELERRGDFDPKKQEVIRHPVKEDK